MCASRSIHAPRSLLSSTIIFSFTRSLSYTRSLYPLHMPTSQFCALYLVVVIDQTALTTANKALLVILNHTMISRRLARPPIPRHFHPIWDWNKITLMSFSFLLWRWSQAVILIQSIKKHPITLYQGYVLNMNPYWYHQRIRRNKQSWC